jgi:hypothetical protein
LTGIRRIPGPVSAIFRLVEVPCKKIRSRHRLQKLDPGLRILNLEDELGPYSQRDYVVRYAEGLRAAGLPD